MTGPTHTTSDRGFVHLEPVKGTDNGGVRVYESSGVHAYWPEVGDDGTVTQGEAEGPFIWVRVWQQYDLDEPKKSIAAHLTIEAARTLRDQLTWLIERSADSGGAPTTLPLIHIPLDPFDSPTRWKDPSVTRFVQRKAGSKDARIKQDARYFAKIHGSWFFGTFSKQWYGWSFDDWGESGIQLDSIEDLYEVDLSGLDA